MRKLYTVFCLFILFTVACENMIDTRYPSDQIGTTQVFEDVETANSALAGLYAALRDQSVITGGTYYGVGSLLSSYTDDMDCYFNDQNGVTDIYLNQVQETNSTVNNIWSYAYRHIYYANSIIYGAKHSARLPDPDKNRIEGEALFVRSLLYYYLQQLFGDIPYTTSLDYENNRKLVKTDESALLTLLEIDLKEASALLEDDYRDEERIYPNRKSAQLLLARIYLQKEEWTLAQKMADTIISSPLYQFQTDINEVFHKTGRHIIWQLKPQNSNGATGEAGFYYFTDSAPYSFVLSQSLIDSFDPGDLRRQNWIAAVTYDGQTWYRPYKYKNWIDGDNTDEYSIVFRLEEVYFIKAEALAKQNLFDEALPYLNATRERSGLTPLTSLSGEEFINELLIEKRREFFGEQGLRFIDMKRLNRLDDLVSVKTNWADYKKVWPLPQNEMLMNKNLSPQNIGY